MQTKHQHASGFGGAKAPISAAMQEIYHRAVPAAGARGRLVTLRCGARVHLIEAGDGPPVVHLHGTSTSGLSHLSLIEHMPDVHSIAVDRPGAGLSDPVILPVRRYREAVVEVMDDLMDTLGLPKATLVGASGGGAWALWYALARPGRVHRLALLGATPLLPGTRTPLPMRVMTTPALGDLLARLFRPTRAGVIRFMRIVGEGDTIVRHQDLLDSLVAAQTDPVLARATRAEFRVFLTPFALGEMRPSMRFRPEELHHLRVPTLLVWGARDPLGGKDVARSIAAMIPTARVEVLDTGHVPWLGRTEEVSRLLSDFAREDVTSSPLPSS